MPLFISVLGLCIVPRFINIWDVGKSNEFIEDFPSIHYYSQKLNQEQSHIMQTRTKCHEPILA